ncbi:hypothetical protein OJAV_G00114690 [Oryzias javanicus]|uniref:UPAR/Ly6 domain-containing protein n=1 Tax=Oryzias javanicus TaxID=123683 RepID=A0A437CWT2_ORYJA|nr:hypothetical protein OJAV_G00114690 [Oryzias javanicus]
MGKLLLTVAVAIASFIAAESLVCNKCSFSLLGFCMNAANETCKDVNSTCFTSVSTFPSLSSFKGFNTQGCAFDSTGCGKINTFSFLGVPYDNNYTCCSTDRCNPVVSGAPASRMALTAAVGASVLAVVFSM